jgi:hypothetical protein
LEGSCRLRPINAYSDKSALTWPISHQVFSSLIIGDADRDVARAALDRAAKVMQERTAAAMRYAEMLAAIERLANATGCPDDADAAQWLLGLGLIEPDGPCGYRLTAAATLRAV